MLSAEQLTSTLLSYWMYIHMRMQLHVHCKKMNYYRIIITSDCKDSQVNRPFAPMLKVALFQLAFLFLWCYDILASSNIGQAMSIAAGLNSSTAI